MIPFVGVRLGPLGTSVAVSVMVGLIGSSVEVAMIADGLGEGGKISPCGVSVMGCNADVAVGSRSTGVGEEEGICVGRGVDEPVGWINAVGVANPGNVLIMQELSRNAAAIAGITFFIMTPRWL